MLKAKIMVKELNCFVWENMIWYLFIRGCKYRVLQIILIEFIFYYYYFFLSKITSLSLLEQKSWILGKLIWLVSCKLWTPSHVDFFLFLFIFLLMWIWNYFYLVFVMSHQEIKRLKSGPGTVDHGNHWSKSP